MGDDEERSFVRGEEVLERAQRVGVEVVRRLVEEEQVGRRREEAREGEARTLAAGEGSHLLPLRVAVEEEALEVAPRIDPLLVDRGHGLGDALEDAEVAVEGRALLIPGATFTGKTTLVHALVQAGATYYSDEYAVLDDAGAVHPYPRPLSIRSGDGNSSRERRAGPAGRIASSDERALAAAVVITRYRAGVVWRPRRLTSGQGLLALLANTVPAQARPEESLRALGRAIAGATTLEGDRGDAGPVATALLDELAALPHRNA